jgi:hypothetical protein
MEASEDSIFGGIGKYTDIYVQLLASIFTVLVDYLESCSDASLDIHQSAGRHIPEG